MYKRFVILMCCVLAMGVTAQAGTFTIVDLPAKGTDAAIGISTSKTYTHAFDFGNSAPTTINEVAFERGPTGNMTAVHNGTSRQGYGYTISDTRASMRVYADASNDPSAQADGSTLELLRSMIYYAGPNAGEAMLLTLRDLIPGTTYSTRFYYRSWSLAGPDPSRAEAISADGETNGVFSDTITVGFDAGGAHYIDYTFIADDTDVTFRFAATVSNYGVHIYGFTNEVLRVPSCATFPVPEDKDDDISRDTLLAWESGKYAHTHDIYIGLDPDAVAAAGRTNHPAGVAFSQGHDANMFDPGRLEFGKTYYWRVDEVNAPPSNVIYEGFVWSFEIEPYSIPVTNVKATASSRRDADSGPEKTIDGSGLNADDQHSTTDADMWLTNMTSPQPAWILYEFDRPYKLDKMLAWNANQTVEPSVGFGVRDVIVEYSTDANDWKALDPVELAQATGLPTYAGDSTPVEFGGKIAKYVRLTIQSNWSPWNIPQFGLSEVRFLAVPTRARQPQPAVGAGNVAEIVTLAWRSGREAGIHEVYLGTDPHDLTLAATVNEPFCELEVDLGVTYYWQVVEVNAVEDPAAWEGDVWSFTTKTHREVDTFETYTIDSPNRVFQTWIDGGGFSADDFFPQGSLGNGTGSYVGYNPESGIIMEPTTVHGGRQSAPFEYGSGGKATSEATRTFTQPDDWTKHNIQSLCVFFAGKSDNMAARLYVRINNGTKMFYQGAQSDLSQPIWIPFTVDLAAAGTSLTSVSQLTIGVEGTGASGTLYIDDIRLYPKAADLVTAVVPDSAGLVAHYRLDGDGKDVTGKHNGTLVNSPAFAPGKYGDALSVTLDQYVNVPYAADLSLNTFTVAAWVNVSDIAGARGILGTRFNGDNTFDVKVDATRVHGDIGNGTDWLNTAIDVPAILSTGEWYHICYVLDDAADTVQMYVNGMLARTMIVKTAFVPDTFLFMKAGQDLRIGTDHPEEPFRGMIDDVRIYNRPLSSAEVASLADRTTPTYVPFE